MRDKSATKNGRNFAVPKASASALRGRQSMRASFKLTFKCIEAMNILGSHLGLKPKSLFDHMVQESDTLEAIADRAKTLSLKSQQRLAKTYVISRDAVELLEVVSRSRHISRNVLVEASVQHLMPLIEKEQIRHASRKNLLIKMEQHMLSGKQLRDDIATELGENDPMSDKMKSVMVVYERAFAALAEFIQKGDNIEDFKLTGK